MESVIELIKRRKSTRTFEEAEIETEKLNQLNDYILKINADVNSNIRFLLSRTHGTDTGTAKKLGTYGVIKGANTFIVGITEHDKDNALEFGYLFEKIILFATSIGLQTCWLGGTFKKSDFSKHLNLNKNESIAIISPVGYEKGKPRVLESAMRTMIGANKRKPWNDLFLDSNAKPLDINRDSAYYISLEMVRLGPSASNKQPWRIIKDKNIFHFCLCRTKGYGVTSYDMQKNDIGIAKCHFELSANELGLKGKWTQSETFSAPFDWEYICSWADET